MYVMDRKLLNVYLIAMNPRHLEIFLAVCECGTFTATAARIGVSEPAISRVIRGMESRFGTRLFERTGRGVQLTHAGHVCMDRARKVIAELDILDSEMRNLLVENSGSVRVSIPMRMGGHFVHELTKQIIRKLPNADIRIEEAFQEKIHEDLWEGRTDVAIICDSRRPKGLYADPVGIDHLALVGHPTRLGPDSSNITMKEAARHGFLLPGDASPYTRYIFDTFSHEGLELSVVRKLHTIDALLAFTAENEGVTILPEYCVQNEALDGRVSVRRIVDQPLSRTVYVASKRKANDPLMKVTIEALKRQIDSTRDLTKWST